MGRTVHCVKLGIETEGLNKPPFPGEQGQRIFEHISAQVWEEWLKLQTMLINEHRLTPFQAKDKQFLANEREKFFFGPGASAPESYVPPKE
jgi:Fe-S cluster biosynthesis and repair protein YggX